MPWALRHYTVNPTSLERVRTREDGPLELKDVCVSRETPMLGLTNTRVRQPQLTTIKPRHTRPDPRTREHGQPKCVSAQQPIRHSQHGERNRVSRRSAMSYYIQKPWSAKDRPRSVKFGVNPRCRCKNSLASVTAPLQELNPYPF